MPSATKLRKRYGRGRAEGTKRRGPTLLTRSALHRQIAEVEALHGGTLRELIVDGGRIDILATDVLGLQIEWHHLEMLKHRSRFDWAMVLAWRGCGKTLIWQATCAIHDILVDPNVRISFASRAADNAKETLDFVKKQFESNETLRAVFGDYVGDDWSKEKLTVSKRNRIIRGPTLGVMSQEGATASKHCEKLYGDDVADQKNSQTKYQRDVLDRWWWKTVMPTVEPDTSEVYISGTRYHPDDQYGRLGAPDMIGGESEIDGPFAGERTLIIPAIQEDGDGEEHSTWKAKFPLKHLCRIRQGSSLDFETQYQQNVSAMKGGGVIEYEQIQQYNPRELEELIEGLPKYLGSDLAIGKKKKNDEFWLVVGAFDKSTGNIYVVDQIHGRFSFGKQRGLLVEFSHEYRIIRGVIEAIAYQAAMIDELKDEDPLLPVVGFKPKLDKLTRMQRRTSLFESGQVWIPKHMTDLIYQLVSFTGEDGRRDDGADAWEFMVRAIGMKKKKPRKKLPLFS